MSLPQSVADVLKRYVALEYEEVIRENLDIGRPRRVKLIFDWRIRRG